MRIDVWSDIVCPWCYIGETRFDRALAQFDGEVAGFDRSGQIHVRRHPFQLDPEAPIPGVPARERYTKKFGDEATAILDRVTGEAEREGLHFDFNSALTANTFDAHRALAFARANGDDRAFEQSLFSAYFTEGLDISDRRVLTRRGADTGLDAQALAAYLEGDDGVDDVRRELVAAFDQGITAVPSFVFNGEFLVPGAVDTDTFVRILEQMRDVA
jgi:predicted DsbA family dithiol-disulfide isomerase